MKTSTNSFGDLMFKRIMSEEELLIDFLNSYFSYMSDDKKIGKAKAHISEKTEPDGLKAYHVMIQAYLTSGEEMPIGIYKKEDDLIIVRKTDKEKIEVLS